MTIVKYGEMVSAVNCEARPALSAERVSAEDLLSLLSVTTISNNIVAL